MKIQLIEKASPKIIEQLVDGVRHFNTTYLGYTDASPLLSIIKDDNANLLGGVAGRTIYGHFLIEVVWVSGQQRGQGLGTQLMLAAEKIARARGCIGAQVDTLSFQGIEFYTSLGFKEVGRVKNFPEGYDRVFYHKDY